MFIEIKIALNFLLSYLYDKLPRRRVNLLGEELEKYLKLKLISTNWPNTSSSSTASTPTTSTPSSSSTTTTATTSTTASCLNESRCFYINKNDLIIDTCLIVASNESAMDLKEILINMPDYLKIFIEPGLVAYLLEPFDFVSSSSIRLDKYLKILYKLPQIDINALNYFSTMSNFDLVQLISSSSSSNSNKPACPILPSPTTTAQNTSLNFLLNKININDDLSSQLKRPIKNGNLKTLTSLSSGQQNSQQISTHELNDNLWSPSSSSSSCSSSSSSLSATNLKLKLFDTTNTTTTTTNTYQDPQLLASPIESPIGNGLIDQTTTTTRSLKPPTSLFTTAEFAQTKFGSTKSKNSFNSLNGKSKHQIHHQSGHHNNFNNHFNSFNSSNNSHHSHNHHHHHHTSTHLKYNQQANNSDFAAYIKQKVAQQQLLKSPTSPIQQQYLGLNRLINASEDYIEPSLFDPIGVVNTTPSSFNSSFSSSSSSSAPSSTSSQQQLAANLLISNLFKSTTTNNNLLINDLIKSNNLFDLNNNNLLNDTKSTSNLQVPNQFITTNNVIETNLNQQQQQHNQSFDLIVNSTIKEMIDNYDDDEDEYRKYDVNDDNNGLKSDQKKLNNNPKEIDVKLLEDGNKVKSTVAIMN